MFLPLLHWSPGEISPLDSQSAVRKTQFIRYSRSARQVRKKEPLYTTFLETPVPTRLPPCISCEFYARLGHFSMKAATEKMTDETPNFWSVYREGFIQFDYRIQIQGGTTKLVSAYKLQSDLPNDRQKQNSSGIFQIQLKTEPCIIERFGAEKYQCDQSSPHQFQPCTTTREGILYVCSAHRIYQSVIHHMIQYTNMIKDT